MRYQQCGYGVTLGESVASEGLADQFAEYISGLPPARWSCSLKEADWKKILPSLKDEWNRADYNHAAWFMDKETIRSRLDIFQVISCSKLVKNLVNRHIMGGSIYLTTLLQEFWKKLYFK